jgi:hypothetical protein
MKIEKEITTKISSVEIDVEIIKDLKTNKNASDFDIYCIEKTIEKAKKFQKNNIVRLRRTMENNYISWKFINSSFFSFIKTTLNHFSYI